MKMTHAVRVDDMTKQGTASIKEVPNMLTFDVEEWTSMRLMRSGHSDANALRDTQSGLRTALDLLDKYGVKATFFIVGKTAELSPELIREIPSKHEIASHGFVHKSLRQQTLSELRKDVEKSVQTIDKFCRRKPIGYRAPYSSLSLRSKQLLQILRDLNFKYDSSLLAVQFPQSYLRKPLLRPYRISLDDPLVEDEKSPLIEYPLSYMQLLGIRVPTCGGFFTRLFGYSMMAKTISRFNKSGWPAMVYFHPWELAAKPMVTGVRGLTTLRIPCTGILKKLLAQFNFTSIETTLWDMA